MSAAARPLEGRRVLLTRSAEDASEWAERFAAAGAAPIVLACITTEPLAAPELQAAVATADWLVFTSRRGVAAAAQLLGGTALPAGCRIAAVAAATGEAARAAFGRVDLLGTDGTAEGLAAALSSHGALGADTNVVLALAANAGEVLERAARNAGARCTRCNVYRTVPAPRTEPRQALSALGADNIVLASPSAVEGLVNQVELDVPAAIYTIGPSTSAAVRRRGLAVTAQAREPSFEGLLEAMQWQS